MDCFGSRKSLISQYEEMNEAVKLCRQSAAMGMGNVLIGMNPMHKNKQEEYTVIEKVVFGKKGNLNCSVFSSYYSLSSDFESEKTPV